MCIKPREISERTYSYMFEHSITLISMAKNIKLALLYLIHRE